jgi:multiple sugar transport system substrate-binding protein
MPDLIIQPQAQEPPQATSVIPPVPKRKFPKVVLFIAPLILLVLAAAWIFFKNSANKTPSGGEITWWSLWEDQAVVAPLITEYEQKNPKVKIKYVEQSKQDYRERLTNALAKGAGPDIFTFHNSWVPMFKNDLDRLPANIMSASDFFQTFYPTVSTDLTSESGIVGIPLGYDALTLYINNDIFAASGKTPPETWDDLRSLAIELTKKDDQGNIIQSGVALGRTENVDHWQEILALMMLQNGVDLGSPTGKLASDALTFFTLFSSSDGVWDATLPNSTAFFAGGKLAMYFAPSWRAMEIVQMNPALNFRTVPIPQLPQNSSGRKSVSYASYWVQGVWAKSKNKEVAWNFLNYISAKEALSKIYANAAGIRRFGEPYPRIDMAGLLKEHPILGSIISLAPSARSWYLQSRTFDGPTGINSLIGKYFEDAVNAVNSGSPADKVLPTVAQGVSQVLRQYGLVK